MATVTKNTFVGNECKVEIFIDQTSPGNAPTNSDWTTASDDVHEIYVAQSVSCNASSDSKRIYGLNQRKPYGTKDGNIEYSWDISGLYTTTAYTDDGTTAVSYDILELIDKDGTGTKFAMLVTMQDASGDSTGVSGLKYIEMTGCSVEESNWDVSHDGDASISLSGMAEARTILASI
jgi:hypothetical protein